jgi:DNA-binding HxlR family transcriptional regulator
MKECECPIDTVANILGSKWIILLLRDLLVGRTRFSEFKEANPTLSNKVLAQKLVEMVEAGLIKRKVSDSVSYSLTKDGLLLKPVMMSLVQFGKEYCTNSANYDALVEKLQ